MTYLNEITLIGRLGKNPEARALDNGTSVANFTIATTRSWKDAAGEWKDETQWHNVQAWGNLAEAAKRLKKGELAFVKGEMRYRKYVDKDGVERSIAEVVASKVGSLTPKPKTQEGAAPAESNQSWTPSAPDVMGDDLPF